MEHPIHFGTSGWRAIIADEFTFPNVRLASAAIADHVISLKKGKTLIVGYDKRFLSENFAFQCAAILRQRGIDVLLCDAAAPTPAIAYEIRRRKTAGAINFTASHNPYMYNGLKFSGPDGAPALPEITKDIEARATQLGDTPIPAPDELTEKPFEKISVREPYLKRLEELVRFDVIIKAKLKLIYDPLHGCGAGYLDSALAAHGVDITSISTNRDVLFDGTAPDVSEKNLAPLHDAVLQNKANAGLASDGDADRFGMIDSDGTWFSPNHILALVYDYLVESRGWRMPAGRSVATTSLIDAVARTYGTTAYETPVGFKYVGALIEEDKIALGGEESAGLSIRGHVPEKDGILADLLVAEMIAARGASLREQLSALFRKVGAEFWPLRDNLELSDEIKANAVERMKSDFKEFAGHRVAKEDRTDGLKLIFDDGSWILMRLSGTEPVLRVYTESSSQETSRRLAQEVEKWINESPTSSRRAGA